MPALPRETVDTIHSAMTTEMLHDRPLIAWVGGGDPGSVGHGMVRQINAHAGWNPDDHILDFGCGCGRVAAVLAQHLSDAASYTGIDILPTLVNFAQQQISSRRPNFRFFTIRSGEKGAERDSAHDQAVPMAQARSIADTYTLGGIDLCVATSLFTHVGPDVYRDYFAHMRNALRKSGRVFMTAFLIDEPVRGLMNRCKPAFTFQHPYEEDGFWLEDKKMPWHAVAVDLNKLATLAFESGLYVEKVLFGSWPGRPRASDFQDILVLRRVPCTTVSCDVAL